ncbi:ChaN family lipoprotein [Pedobacter frigidisoli]|uniref:ChaN family lipoprotein n=1 Tax=Pedobacter frigidisoli TaxID=2530455 RepID=UPI00292E64B3|nr:ChaN family lipoprotein [Pedobacter frigidisoli]
MNTQFKIYSIKKQKVVSLSEIIADMSKRDVLFFGEEHNDSVGHYLEAEIFKLLNQKYPNQIALSLEMFHTDIQPVIDEYLADAISEKNFIKEGRAWSNYSDYKALIEYAKSSKLAVIGANAAARYSNAVTKGGLGALQSFPKSSLAFLPPVPIDTASGRYYEKFTDLLGGHSMGTMKVYQTQNFWDATMAWSISKFLKNNKSAKVFQINGRFHSDEKLGTVAQLVRYAPKASMLNISAFPDDGFENPDWSKFSNLGDYVIITNPKVKRSY